MCDNTKIHDQVQASIATATREVDVALESVRAMRRAILAQMVRDTADLDTPTFDEVAEAIQRVRALHKPFTRKVPALWSNAGELETLCSACEVQSDSAFYPCPTIQALDGDSNE